MAFIAIHTPRTGSKRPAMILPTPQGKNRAPIKRLMKAAMDQAGIGKNREVAPSFIRLPNAIGISRPVITHTGETAPEVYLLGGVDAGKLDESAIRDVQLRLIDQTAGLAEGLITQGIPWAQRGDVSYRTQFVTGDIVLRDELSSYAMMFPRLPETTDFDTAQGKQRNKWFTWKLLLLLPLLGALALVLTQVFQRPPEKIEKAEIAVAVPEQAPSGGGSASATQGTIVIADPYANADEAMLEKALKELRLTRSQLMDRKTQAASTPESLMNWERESIRFNRRRMQMLAAFDRLRLEMGQGSLEPIFIEDYGADLHLHPDRLLKARADLAAVRKDLAERRVALDPKDTAKVEDFNDTVEWFNLRAESFNQAAARTGK